MRNEEGERLQVECTILHKVSKEALLPKESREKGNVAHRFSGVDTEQWIGK
jgi:hypothetical protein